MDDVAIVPCIDLELSDGLRGYLTHNGAVSISIAQQNT